ncbi:hypothetical protein BX666DRAFT_1856358 [Dichotomocladium elegans]|nr:hypothetical protein BX666DRAFT_1856358 [Dichotomocladium elegans]
MVQCDQCEVWQHCDCVGLEEKDIPEQYYCEECKPENHSVVRMAHGRYVHVNALEITRNFLDPVPGSPPPLPSSPCEITESDQRSDNSKPKELTKTTEKRGRGTNNGRRGNSTVKRSQSNRPRSRTSTPQPSEHGYTSATDPQSSIFEKLSPAARESSPPAKIRYPSSRMTISEMNRRTKQILEYISSIQVEMANKDTIDLPRTDADTACIGTSNPVQPLSEFKATSDNQMPNLATGAEQNNGKPAAIIIPTKKDDCAPSSSMSSASTIPLDEPIDERLHQEKSVAEEALERMSADKMTAEEKEAQSSLEIMDMLTRELIKFQRRFGSANAPHFGRARNRDSRTNEAEAEGRTTRSREASANSTAFLSEKRMAQA